MSQITGIPFTDAMHNFWRGCVKISAGCKYCYMYREYGNRFKNDPTKVVIASGKTFADPQKWKAPQIIFINSWSDFFIKEADEHRADAWQVIKNTPQHFYLVITKRIDRAAQCLPTDWEKGYDNVMFIVSTENQKTANYRINKLLQVPCKWRGVIAEPLLEAINLTPFLTVKLGPDDKDFIRPIDWVIVGGESGNDNGDYKYRPCKLEWLQILIKQCRVAEVPIFVKQVGTMLAKQMGLKNRHGANINEPGMPIALRQQYYPKIDHIAFKNKIVNKS